MNAACNLFDPTIRTATAAREAILTPSRVLVRHKRLETDFRGLKGDPVNGPSIFDSPLFHFNSPKSIVRSDDAERTTAELARPQDPADEGDQLIGASPGANSAQLTVPLWPGSL